MSVVTGSSEAAGGAGGGGARVFFQSPRGGAGGSPGSSREDSAPAPPAAGQVQQQRRHQQGKVTVKYDRKELRKRLVLEEWIVEQLGQLYGCEEEEMPDVEIDIDDLLDADSEEERASKLQEALVDCYKPTELDMLNWLKETAAYLDRRKTINERPSHTRHLDFDIFNRVWIEKKSKNVRKWVSLDKIQEFIKELLSRIRGMRKLSPPQKKSV